MEASEHRLIGNHASADPSLGLDTDGWGTLLLEVGGAGAAAQQLTYGDLVALGGDFYGTPDLSPIGAGPDAATRIERFLAAHRTLVEGDRGELAEVMAIMDQEASETLEPSHRTAVADPTLGFLRLGNSLNYAWNEATGGAPAADGAYGLWRGPGRYTRLATTNLDHFGEEAVLAWRAGHEAACRLAERDLQAALAMNAHADHFLTDLFAGGHIRTPRRALHEHRWAGAALVDPVTVGALLSKAMHDEENATAPVVTSRARPGRSWRAYGDREVLGAQAAENLEAAIGAVRASVEEVLRAAAEPGRPLSFDALDHVPFVPGPHPPVAGPSIMPMFVVVDGTIRQRGTWTDRGPGPPDGYRSTDMWTWPVAIATTLLPDMVRGALDPGAIREALQQGLLSVLPK